MKDAFELANHILVNTGIVRELYNDKTPEGVSRYENIQELLNGIKDFVEQERSPQEEEVNDVIKDILEKPEGDLFASNMENRLKTLDEFMQEITLLTDVDKESDEEKNSDKVSLMTVHASKGLEFKYVYVVGLEENLFPSQLSINNRADLEEERRLFYVALTRAEKKATLSFATMRYRFGNVTYCEPSRFIDEIDSKYLDYPEEETGPQLNDSMFEKMRGQYNFNSKNNIGFKSGTSNFSKSAKPISNETKGNIGFQQPKKLVSLASRPNQSSASTQVDIQFNKQLIVNQSVFHEKFGTGTILQLEGNWPETKALIEFKSGDKRSLLLRFARLGPVS